MTTPTDAKATRATCLHQLFEAQVAQSPDALAISAGARELTFAELNARANQVAARLIAYGVGPETLVALYAERSPELLIAILGVLKAGGAYLPIDPAHAPADRVRFMLDDSGAAVVLVQEALAGDLPDSGRLQIEIEETAADPAAADPNVSVSSANAAYVIYTSGSTGVPKGTTIAHASVVNLALWQVKAFGLAATHRLTMISCAAFDAHVWEIWQALLAGASLHVVPREAREAPDKLVAWLKLARITACWLPTPLAELVLDQPWPGEFALERLTTAGDVLHRGARRELKLQLHNLYGPTEATVCTTHAEVPPGTTAPPPIGQPIGNVRTYVLDVNLAQVPVNVAGELFVGGASLARGYLGRPDLTAERFLPDPFAPTPGARMYRTGDRVRWRPDRQLEFLGRIDHQLKIRGFRVELGEIETVLGTHSGVREVVVTAWDGNNAATATSVDKRMVAYVVPRDGELPGDLRGFLEAKLPDYMIPSTFVRMDALPRGASGKVDRKALPLPPDPGTQRERPRIAPRSPAEKLLATIWAELLRADVDRVSVDDNFFASGGDSILAIQVVARANLAGLEITPRQIFETPTIAELALVAAPTDKVAIDQGPVTGPCPLTPIQHWFLEQPGPAPAHYNQSALLEVRRDLEPALLEKALAQVVLHHDALRLRIHPHDGTWRQDFAPTDAALSIAHFDLSALATEARRDAIKKTTGELQASLDLTRGPIVRAALFALGADEPRLLFVASHHVAIDGVSWRILLEDLERACTQLRRGEAIDLPLKTTSFQTWAHRLEAQAQRAETEAELAYWSAVPAAEAAAIPSDHAGATDEDAGGAREVVIRLGADETAQLLKEVPRAYHTQINDVLLAAVARAFARWTGRRSLQLDLEGHGRDAGFDDVDLTRTVGWFTSGYPIRIDLPDSPEPRESLQYVKEMLRKIPRGGIGYGLLRYLGRDASRAALQRLPASQVSFNYLGQLDQALSPSSPFAPSTETTGSPVSSRTPRRHQLDVLCAVLRGVFEVTIHYSERRHRPETIATLADNIAGELRQLIAHCVAPDAGGYTPSDFPLAPIDQEALDRLLADADDSGDDNG